MENKMKLQRDSFKGERNCAREKSFQIPSSDLLQTPTTKHQSNTTFTERVSDDLPQHIQPSDHDKCMYGANGKRICTHSKSNSVCRSQTQVDNVVIDPLEQDPGQVNSNRFFQVGVLKNICPPKFEFRKIQKQGVTSKVAPKHDVQKYKKGPSSLVSNTVKPGQNKIVNFKTMTSNLKHFATSNECNIPMKIGRAHV